MRASELFVMRESWVQGTGREERENDTCTSEGVQKVYKSGERFFTVHGLIDGRANCSGRSRRVLSWNSSRS